MCIITPTRGCGVLQSFCLSVSVSMCVSVCLSASISLEPLDQSFRIFVQISVAVARSSSDGVAIMGHSLMSIKYINALYLLHFA